MDLQKIKTLITQAAGAVKANEKLPLPVIAAKARREAKANPTDVPLINVSHVLTKMASDQTFISKEQLGDIVNRFTATHSKLAQVFSDELGKVEANPALFVREQNEGASLDHDYDKFSDPVLSNALRGAMAEEPEERIYSSIDAQKAQRAAYAQLIGIGVQPKEVNTFAGRKDIIICQAVHETPLGVANMLIPVELREGKALMPTMFFSSAGFDDLNKDSYIAQIKVVAGRGFRVDGNKLLDVLEQVKKGSGGVDEVELAVIKIASERGTPVQDNNSILYTAIDEPKMDVQPLEFEPTKESTFAETLGKPDGVACFVHGDRAVEAGREMLIRKLAEFGYKNVQVKVQEVDDKKVFYAVAIGVGTGLKVPVDVVGNKVMPPKILFADGAIAAFGKTSIDEIISSKSGGNKRSLATASSCHNMSPSELVDIVKKSVAEGNFIRAEEAINVLGEVNPHAQKAAIAHMMIAITNENGNEYLIPDGPGGKTKKESHIENMRRIANQPIQETPQFMDHKIFFPEGA